MNPDERDRLIEAAASAYRERDTEGRIRPSPAWLDAPADVREEIYERQLDWRRLERAADDEGLSATARIVLSRLARLPQF
jgi:hypothetical protein